MADGRGGSRGLIIAIVIIALIAVITYAMGLWNVDASGDLKAPDVKVETSGGEVPDVQVETGDIDVGTTTETVKVPEIDVKTDEAEVKLPTLSVDKAGDDNSAEK